MSRAKEILMMRSGNEMNRGEQYEFKRSIDSFVELINDSRAEVAAAQKVVMDFVA